MTQAGFEDLRNGVVLAELGGHGDGPYCARHGAGAALVLLGTYVVDPGDSVPYSGDFVFKSGRENYAAYLEEHVAAARQGGARVGLSVITIDLADSLDFLQAAQDAGADYASLCAYSVMDMFTESGLGVALCWPENRGVLERWSHALVGGLDIPVIFKIGLERGEVTTEAIDVMTQCGVPIVHVDVGGCESGSRGLRAVPELARRCGFLIAGGGVKDAGGARRLLEAGAGAAAIATAAMEDEDLCGRIQAELR